MAGTVDSDAAAVARLVAGEDAALGEIYDAYAGPCLALARRVLVDEALAQDCIQEVFLQFWRDPTRFDATKGSLGGWLRTLSHRRAVDLVRREQVIRKRRETDDFLAERPSPDAGPAQQAEEGMRSERVVAALMNLPDVQREALALAYYGGYTQREVAELTGAPLGTVKTRMLAGMRKLREVLAEFAPGADYAEGDLSSVLAGRGLRGGEEEP